MLIAKSSTTGYFLKTGGTHWFWGVSYHAREIPMDGPITGPFSGGWCLPLSRQTTAVVFRLGVDVSRPSWNKTGCRHSYRKRHWFLQESVPSLSVLARAFIASGYTSSWNCSIHEFGDFLGLNSARCFSPRKEITVPLKDAWLTVKCGVFPSQKLKHFVNRWVPPISRSTGPFGPKREESTNVEVTPPVRCLSQFQVKSG